MSVRTILAAIFDLVLFCCPQAFRASYGAAMRRDVRDELARARGPLAALGYAFHAFGDCIATAIDERTHTLRGDLATAWRAALAAPGFTFVLVGTVALAIGSNVAVFSVVRAVVLAPLPFPDATSIVALRGLRDGVSFALSLPDFADVRDASHGFVAMAAFASESRTQIAGRHGETLAIAPSTVTPAFFDVFAIAPKLGRFFNANDARPGAAPVVVIAERFWRGPLGADPNVIGETIAMPDGPRRIVGVAPERLAANGVNATSADVWSVVDAHENSKQYTRDAHYFDGIARLAPGATVARAAIDLETIFARLRVRYPETDKHYGIGVSNLLDDVVGDIRPTLVAIFAAVCGVLAIAAANVANLLLGRATTRDRELTVRLALGASRRRIVTQLLTETCAYATLGGALGFGLAVAAVRAFVGAHPTNIPRIEDVGVDLAALGYCAGLVLAVTFLAGLVPALAASRRDLATTLATAGRSGDASRGGLARASLVAFEIACTVALVVVAGLVIRSYGALTNRPLAFEPRDVTIVGGIQLPRDRYVTDGARRVFFDESLGRVRAIPGVVSASWAYTAPFVAYRWNQGFFIAGRRVAPGEMPVARMDPIGVDYFRTLGIVTVRGRTFATTDRHGAPEVVVVNAAFAKRFFGERSPIGAHLVFGSLDERKAQTSLPTIVGVVADARSSFAAPPEPAIYRPIAQHALGIAILIAKHRPGVAVEAALRAAIDATDAHLLPPEKAAPMADWMAESTARTRLTMQTLAILASIALALALGGVFAVVSYGVSQRTREFGIRMALGARPGAIRRDVIGRAMRVTLVGIVAGTILAALATRSLALALYDVAPLDPSTFGAVALLVALTTLVAALAPAARATSVEPVVALRAE